MCDAKKRAAKVGIPFNIKSSDLFLPDVCPVLGVRLEVASDDYRCRPSLDRLVPSLGYVKGNVRVISYRANTIKSDATIPELKAVIKYMECSQWDG